MSTQTTAHLTVPHFTKLYNGEWAIRLPKGHNQITGDTVRVSRRNGAVVVETLGELVSATQWGRLYRIAAKPAKAPAAPAVQPQPEAPVVEKDCLRGAPIPSNKFIYDANTRTFTANQSDVQEYMDNPNELRVQSVATKKVIVFEMVRYDLNQRGDVTAWEYTCVAHGIRLFLMNA